LGFGVLLAAYVIYAYTPLGGIDGLPALPPEYLILEGAPGSADAPRGPNNVNDMDHQLEVAFGKECLERDYAIKFQVRSKGMVLAAKEFVIEKDGRVKLAPVSCAIFGKNNGDGKFPEINTVRANVAWLTFDRPIVHPADMGKHKIVAGELKGNVDIVNNRRTPERDDDLTLFTQGPLFFKDDEHHSWTKVDAERLARENAKLKEALKTAGDEVAKMKEDLSLLHTKLDRGVSDLDDKSVKLLQQNAELEEAFGRVLSELENLKSEKARLEKEVQRRLKEKK
jgi:hypothetical protein